MSSSDKKKWLTNVRKDQYSWLKSTGKEAGLRASDVLQSVIDEVMNNGSRFKAKMAKAKVQLKIQQLEAQAEALEARKDALLKELKSEKKEERETVVA